MFSIKLSRVFGLLENVQLRFKTVFKILFSAYVREHICALQLQSRSVWKLREFCFLLKLFCFLKVVQNNLFKWLSNLFGRKSPLNIFYHIPNASCQKKLFSPPNPKTLAREHTFGRFNARLSLHLNVSLYETACSSVFYGQSVLRGKQKVENSKSLFFIFYSPSPPPGFPWSFPFVESFPFLFFHRWHWTGRQLRKKFRTRKFMKAESSGGWKVSKRKFEELWQSSTLEWQLFCS